MILFTILVDYGVGQYQYTPPCDYSTLRGLLADLNRENSRRTGEAAPAISYSQEHKTLTVRFSMRWIYTDPLWLVKVSRWEILRLRDGERITLPVNEDQMKVILKGCRINRMKINAEKSPNGYFVSLEVYRSLRERVLEASLEATHVGVSFVPMNAIEMQTARTYVSQAKEMLKFPVTCSYDGDRKQMVLRCDQSEGGRLLEELVTCGDEDKMNEIFEAYKALYFGRNIEDEEPTTTTTDITVTSDIDI